MTPYVVTRYYRAPEVILGMGYQANGKWLGADFFFFFWVVGAKVTLGRDLGTTGIFFALRGSFSVPGNILARV